MLLLLAILPLIVPASNSEAQLAALETDDLRLVYLQPLQSYLAPHVARCFTNSMQFQRRLFDYEPSEKVTVILSDFSDYGNAGAGAVPRNGLAVMIAPMGSAYETYPSNERMNTLMNHELVHVVNFDRPGAADRFWRGVFRGKVKETASHPESIVFGYLTAPRASAPRWYHEGIAVFVETWMGGGLGRAQGSYDEMVFRSMVLDDSRFYDPLGLVSEGTKIDFQVELNSYLYGTRFMSYLAHEYSPEMLIQWVTRGRGSKASYSAQFENVFGRSLDELWREWIGFEHEFQNANLARLREYPITPHQDISARALGSVSRAFLDEPTGRIYAALNYPGMVAHIAAIDVESGDLRRIVDVKGPTMYSVTSLAFDPASRTLFYTTDNSAFRDIVSLDPDTGKQRTLMKDTRIGDLAFNQSDRSLWGLRHDNGMVTLVRIPHPYGEWNQIHTWPYGDLMSDLDVSPDGRLLAASTAKPTGKSEVQVFEIEQLLADSIEPLARFDFGTTIPLNFVFDREGRHLYGSSYYTGVANLFRYDIGTGTWEALSNCETGLFRPIPVSENRVIAFRYSGEGFVPAWIDVEPLEDINAIGFLGARIIEKHPQLAEWKVGSPADVPMDSLETYRGSYRGLRGLELESVYPVVEGYKEVPAYGLSMNIGDPISLHRFALTTSYTPNSDLPEDERLHAEFRYRRYDWRFSARLNDANFYDLFGPTKTSRKGYSVGLGYTRTLLYDMPRELSLSADVAGHGDLERLPDYQNVVSSFDRLLTGSIRLDYRNLRFSLGAVDYEKGLRSSVVLADNHVNGRSFASVVGSFDVGTPLFAHSSVWLRSAGGFAPGEREEPFANFYFGGFGNNWVDHLESKRYRSWYSLPGFELNEIGGTNFVKSMVDWNIPPLRFRRLGVPSFYASWARTSLFAGGLMTNVDDSALRREVLSAGAQMDLRMTLLHHLDFTASVGYAFGFEDGRKNVNEFMFSLKIM